eukprot:IDg6988t1
MLSPQARTNVAKFRSLRQGLQRAFSDLCTGTITLTLELSDYSKLAPIPSLFHATVLCYNSGTASSIDSARRRQVEGVAEKLVVRATLENTQLKEGDWKDV